MTKGVLSEDDIALAGEFALGLLQGADAGLASARMASDPAFAAEVEAWQARLAPLAEADAQAVSPDLWDRIVTSLPHPQGDRAPARLLRLWQGLAAASTAAAAVFALLLVTRPAPPVPVPVAPQPMVAALSSTDGPTALTASYDAATGKLLMQPVRMDLGRRFPELWLIPVGGSAISLGMINAKGASIVVVPAPLRAKMGAGVTLAITPEPAGGAPGGKATGPVVAAGVMTSA
ncbi:hypothetical protein D5I55_02780 [Chakrabartia godavariana]|nr:hypothetical protein D5I55_02780 [Chakrabartia godavariana]